jgi:hypothetical protein
MAHPKINEQALGQHDQPLAVGKDDLVDLPLDLLPEAVAQCLDLDLAVKMADLADEARSFSCRMWSIVIPSMLPVAVTKMSPCEAASSILVTR